MAREQGEAPSTREININNIRLSGVRGALIPVEINQTTPFALVDTGAMRSCLSGVQYQNMGEPSFTALCRGTVRAATGGDMGPLGFLTCKLKINDKVYEHEFVVCKHLITPVILGIDFLRKFNINISWGEEGQIQLKTGTQDLVYSIQDNIQYPVSLPRTVSIPPRSVVSVKAVADLPTPRAKIMYKATVAENFTEDHNEQAVYPICYSTMVGGKQSCVQVIVNLGEERKRIPQGTILGYFERWADEEPEEESDNGEVYVSVYKEMDEESNEELFKGAGTGFLKSPADVDPRKSLPLKDADVTLKARKQFKELCKEFNDIFSKDSSDLGKTPLLKMDIPMGDSPPVSQKPYTLALKHVQWVREEIETLERAGVIVRSVLPWASPIVIVPKKTAPGEPPRRRMCVNYRVLNSLLPRVDKAHSKAKGILTLVPIPKIDEIYAKLEGSTVYSTFDMRSGYYHLELTPESQAKSVFVVGGPRGGKWEFKRCPFGLTQAPAYFQLLVSKVIEGLPFAFGYLDDILVFSFGVEEHLRHVREVFIRLREADLKLSKRKCCFLKAHVQYLGHYILGVGLELVPEKLDSLKQMPAPTDVTGIRKFLGFVGYY